MSKAQRGLLVILKRVSFKREAIKIKEKRDNEVSLPDRGLIGWRASRCRASLPSVQQSGVSDKDVSRKRAVVETDHDVGHVKRSKVIWRSFGCHSDPVTYLPQALTKLKLRLLPYDFKVVPTPHPLELHEELDIQDSFPFPATTPRSLGRHSDPVTYHHRPLPGQTTTFAHTISRNPRYMSLTAEVPIQPPLSSQGKNSSFGQNSNSSSAHNSNSSSTPNSNSSSANNSNSSPPPNSNSSSIHNSNSSSTPNSNSSSTPNSNSSSANNSNSSPPPNSNSSSIHNSNSSSTPNSNSSSAHNSNSSSTPNSNSSPPHNSNSSPPHNSNSSSPHNSPNFNSSSTGQLVLNVDDFGAKADDNNADNFQAFKNAWDRACCSSRPAEILVPERKTYYIKQINFTGPCQSSISMEIRGTIKAFPEMHKFPQRRLWIKFENVTNLEIFGGGTIDGDGVLWWANSCKIKKSQAVTFENCTNLKVSNLTTMNAQQMHVNFQDCNGVEASNLMVVAPESSPNTDGLHFTRTADVNVHDCVIGTGDDCISMVNGTTNVKLSNISCGPGHGISIGSLGEDNLTNYVSNIYVTGVMLTGTMYGVRIKTWPGGSGYAQNIVFENIMMTNVSNPIIIDQNYCDGNKNCQMQKSAVQVENIIYRNIRGTSATNAAINFDCSSWVPCRNIVLENVKLSGLTARPKVQAVCNNLNLTTETNSIPGC
ncbi:pectin lyase-like superfamily protein [Striga asiatica]|uniref:endo-polygalacturonase n=1 Tax=Striga asiatica TaxID=4170 RepID=A0A5A7Q0J8_STRAF|nr:pectin lyase-like superfamily protein [Striga asiatica]